MNILSHIVDYFLPSASKPLSSDQRLRGRVLVIACLLASVVAVIFFPLRLFEHGPWTPRVGLLYVALVGALAGLALYKKTASVAVAGTCVVAIESVVLVWFTTIDGGIYSSAIVWIPMMPIFAVYFAGWKIGVAEALALLACILVIQYGHLQGWYESNVTPEMNELYWGLSILCVTAFLMLLAYAYADSQRRIQGELRTSLQSRDHFLATVSHELRTPLNAIIGMSTLLSRGNAGQLSREQLEYLRDISDSALELLSLVNEVLDFSQAREGRLSLRPRGCNIGQLIRDWARAQRPAVEAKGITLRLELDDRVDTHAVWLDPDRLRQGVDNLLTNAIKFTPRGGTITIGATLTEERLRVQVSDTGIGIPRMELERVFEDFYQTEHGKRLVEAGGTGLGLALTRRLVVLHGGTITAESEGEGRGSTFTIDIPAASRETEHVSLVRGKNAS